MEWEGLMSEAGFSCLFVEKVYNNSCFGELKRNCEGKR